MNIGEVLNGVYDDDIGWRPASGAIKPVHVANGIIRSVQGRYYDLDLLGSFAVWWKQKNHQIDETRTFDALKNRANGRLGYLGSNKDLFEKTRRFALRFLATDRALFPSTDHSSFSLTCGRMRLAIPATTGWGNSARSCWGPVMRAFVQRWRGAFPLRSPEIRFRRWSGRFSMTTTGEKQRRRVQDE